MHAEAGKEGQAGHGRDENRQADRKWGRHLGRYAGWQERMVRQGEAGKRAFRQAEIASQAGSQNNQWLAVKSKQAGTQVCS